jgi:hypothetical protein
MRSAADGYLGKHIMARALNISDKIQHDSYNDDRDNDGIAPVAQSADPFADFVNALVAAPIKSTEIAAAITKTAGATGSLLWTYGDDGDFKLEATTGFLKTSTGNGGFTLKVESDGSYSLTFADSKTKLSYEPDEDGKKISAAGPPSTNTTVYATTNGPLVPNASAGNITWDGRGTAANPVVGNDTVFGGVNDYYIGGTAPHVVAPAGNVGSCLIYTSAKNSNVAPGSVLIDMQSQTGYGSNAEGNHWAGFDQVRGSLQSNVLIGSASGSDLKSGGSSSVLISLGGKDYELRADGTGDVLVSTTGADRVILEATKGWTINSQTTLLGFNAAHGTYIDLLSVENKLGLNIASDITGFLKITDTTEGSHLLLSTDHFASSHSILDMPLVHGLDLQSLVANKNIVI